MTIQDGDLFTLDLGHPEILRTILAQVLATGDVIGRDAQGRTVLTVAIEDWLFDAMAALDADLEDLEPEPDDEDNGLD